MSLFLHYYRPKPVIFQGEFLTIYWYGLIIALALVIGLLIVRFLFKKYSLKRESYWNLFFYLAILGLIGDRLAHVFLYDWDYFSQHLIDIFKVWQGGMAIHGAIFVGILVLWIYSKKRKESFWSLADIIAPALVLGEAIGRWGNYFNQEIYGLPTNLPWSIPIDLVNRVEGYESFNYFHPTFLYLSIWCFLIFLILFFWHSKRIKLLRQIGGIKGKGDIFLAYLFLYSIGRFFIEFLRLDLQPTFLNLRMGQWLSLVLIVFVVIVGTGFKPVPTKEIL